MNKTKYVMYLRKSTDSEDRQIQSIEDQENELKLIRPSGGIKVVKTFKESQSAKKPGRPLYDDMMKMIERGDADGIICWKLNRLSRNPKDGGDIQWLLQQGIIKSIITPAREYLPEDNVLMMAVELGIANQFVLDLSKDVKRGMKGKAERGWRPHQAPLGYLNDQMGEQGRKIIHVDPERFPLVRKMWDFLLAGDYSVPHVLKIATEEWGLRTRRGKELSMSGAYRIFTNPFYYGEFEYGGEIYQGKHQTMVTKEEYDRAQKILGRYGKPRAKHKRLPFNGIIHCAECGSMVTCDEKIKKVKTTGQTKRYLYHRCTKHKKGAVCNQKPVKYEVLTQQIQQQLSSITISEDFLNLALDVLRSRNQLEQGDRNLILHSLQHNHQNCIKKLDNLINLYISPENATRELLTDGEYKERKNSLTQEKAAIEGELRQTEGRVNEWMDLTEKTFHFATYARIWFEKGDFEIKTTILRALGQNFALKEGILHLELKKPYLVIKEGLENMPTENPTLELSKTAVFAGAKAAERILGPREKVWSG